MFAHLTGDARRSSASRRLHGTRYMLALVILVVLTASSFLIMRDFVQDERTIDETLTAIDEMRAELGTQQIAMRDLVAELRAEAPDEFRLRGQRRALIDVNTRLHREFDHLTEAMARADLAPAASAIVEEPPYNLRSILAEMDADVLTATREAEGPVDMPADETALEARPREDGFLAVTDAHAKAARLSADRLGKELREQAEVLQARRESRHTLLGWSTLMVLAGEALIIFWPLIGNLGREARRADAATVELARIARHDTLTGLLNRASLIWEVKRAIARADRETDRLAVLLIDLDRFKPINDMFGHAAGDAVLVEIARRLQAALRPHDIVARLGGDEFVVVMPRSHDDDDVRDLGIRINRALHREMEIQGHRLRLGASIGCAFWPEDAEDVDGLLSSADLAMYDAKRNGRDEPAFFDEELRSDVARVHSQTADLRTAIALDQFTLLYQPIVSLDGAALHGFEALLRWDHPEHGRLTPAEILPLAERAGLMSRITTWVVDHACRQHAAWTAAGEAPGLMSINVAEAFLTQPDAVDQILTIAAKYGVRRADLALEVSERVLNGDDHGPVGEQLAAAHRAGLRVALDEFGLGQATLIHLRKPGIDILKIDRAFVHDLASTPENVAIVGAMIELARILDKQVVVEGIETADQAALLAISERAWVQGFLHARPLCARDATAFMTARRPAPLRRLADAVGA